MTQQKSSFVISEMHPITKTEIPHLAVCTCTSLHPFVVAIRTETMLPNVRKLVPIDIPLVVVTPDA